MIIHDLDWRHANIFPCLLESTLYAGMNISSLCNGRNKSVPIKVIPTQHCYVQLSAQKHDIDEANCVAVVE